MNCSQARDLFAERMDGDLDSASLDRLDRHVASCSACQAEWRVFERSIEDLRAIPHRATSTELQALLLAAVDQAESESSGGAPLPLAVPAPASAHTPPAAGRSRQVATHLIALAAGAIATAAGLLLFPAAAPQVPAGAGAEEVASAPEVKIRYVDREVPVEVPIEVPVEVRIEVPVEVPVERLVEVEVPVEVLRIEYRDRERKPDPVASARALASFAQNMRFVAQTQGELHGLLSSPALLADASGASLPTSEPSVDSIAPQEPPARRARPVARFADRSHPLSEASIRVDRGPGRISISAQGPLSKVVPLLLTKLSDPDPSLVAVVERRLDSIRGAAEADETLAPLLIEVPVPRQDRRLFARRNKETEDPRSPRERWGAWWAANGERIADAGPRLRM